jgi:tetratricopeptide (TPR) repeat protein
MRGRTVGPLEIADLRGYFTAGLVRSDATVTGPAWDGPLPAADAAQWLGVPPPPAAAPAPAVPLAQTLRVEPAWSGSAPAGWRVPVAWAIALAAVQLAIVPAREPGSEQGLAELIAIAASRYALVAAACFVGVGLLWRVQRGHWPGVRAPLVAMSVVYAALAGMSLLQSPAPSQAARTAEVSPPTQAGAASDAWEREQVERANQALAQAELDAVFDPPSDAQALPEAGVEAATVVVDEGGDPATPVAASPAAPQRPAPADADPWQDRARLLYAAADWNGLQAHASQWSRAEPRRYQAWQFLGVAQRNLGQDAAAVASFEQALALGSRDTSTLRNLAYGYLATGQNAKAADACQRILQVEPDSLFALTNYGHAMSLAGEYDQALASVERAAKLYPRDRRVWQSLAAVHRRGGFVDRATAAQEKADSLR